MAAWKYIGYKSAYDGGFFADRVLYYWSNGGAGGSKVALAVNAGTLSTYPSYSPPGTENSYSEYCLRWSTCSPTKYFAGT